MTWTLIAAATDVVCPETTHFRRFYASRQTRTGGLARWFDAIDGQKVSSVTARLPESV
jgi:hypothetical protein